MSNNHQEDTQVLLPDLIIRQSNRDRDGRDLSRVRGVGRVLGRREEGSVGFRLVNECFSTCLMQEGEIQKEKREREREREERERDRERDAEKSSHDLLYASSPSRALSVDRDCREKRVYSERYDSVYVGSYNCISFSSLSPPSSFPGSVLSTLSMELQIIKQSLLPNHPSVPFPPTDPNQDVRTHLRTKWPIIVDISDDDPML
jgi:hypothetical protein